MYNHAHSVSKFKECFGTHITLEKCDESFKQHYIDNDINIETFNRLMIKNEMDEYTYILLAYFYERHYKFFNDEANKKRHLQETKVLELNNRLISETELLIFLLSNKEGKLTNISFQKTAGYFNLGLDFSDDSIINLFLNYYNSNNHNQFKIPFLEDNNVEDDHIDKSKYSISQGVEITKKCKLRECAYLYVYNNPVLCLSKANQSEIKDYVEFLTIKLNQLKKEFRKKGAKRKNTYLTALCEDLSYLKRIDRYIENPNVNYIDEISITNADCKFIHDVLVFFNVIDNKSGTYTTKLPENYIRTILKQSTVDNFSEQYNESRIIRIYELKQYLKQ